MYDVTIALEDRPGALAEMGEALGRAAISIEGGGAFVVGEQGLAHFLFADGAAARDVLERAGTRVLGVTEVLAQQLDQERAGQLGELTRRMADAGVNVQTLYSDHQHRLILTVDEPERGRIVSEAWERERLARQTSPPAGREHHYALAMTWTGNDGDGTRNYRSYRRDFTVAASGKPTILGSADPAFRGASTRSNPEELLLAALSACHMLSFLHLCAVRGIEVLTYTDHAAGTMRECGQSAGEFTSVTLRPEVTFADSARSSEADSLHEQAHTICFIARSVNFPVRVQPTSPTEDVAAERHA